MLVKTTLKHVRPFPWDYCSSYIIIRVSRRRRTTTIRHSLYSSLFTFLLSVFYINTTTTTIAITTITTTTTTIITWCFLYKSRFMCLRMIVHLFSSILRYYYYNIYTVSHGYRAMMAAFMIASSTMDLCLSTVVTMCRAFASTSTDVTNWSVTR